MYIETLESSRPAGRLGLAWVRYLNGLVRTPVLDPRHPDRAYVLIYDEKRRRYDIEAFRKADGSRIWTAAVPNGGYGTPAVRGDQLIVLSRFTEVTALSTEDGRELWTFHTDQRVRSAVVVIDDLAFASAGGTIVGLDRAGRTAYEAHAPGAFFFGAVAAGPEGSILSLGTRHERGTSRLFVWAFDRQGRLTWRHDLGTSSVASADTSGVRSSDGVVYVGADGAVFAIDAADGSLRWRSKIEGAAFRAVCVLDGERVYATTIDGYLAAFDRATGAERWSKFLTTEGIWMPASVSADRVFVVAAGVLQAFDPATGLRLQELAVGESPYSACVLTEDHLLLGGGDPPYHGLLLGFALRTDDARDVRCQLERELFIIRPGDTIDLSVTVTGHAGPVQELTVDLRSLDGPGESRPLRRDGATFAFTVAPGPGRRWGTYALPVTIDVDGQRIVRTLRLVLENDDSMPRRVLLTDVPRVVQEKPNYSGAAIMQAVRALHGDDVEQVDMRRTVDAILEKARDYSPFQIWRIIARRALLSGARKPEELPELRERAE
jgi:outer membrane protein assembly factor BamB